MSIGRTNSFSISTDNLTHTSNCTFKVYQHLQPPLTDDDDNNDVEVGDAFGRDFKLNPGSKRREQERKSRGELDGK